MASFITRAFRSAVDKIVTSLFRRGARAKHLPDDIRDVVSLLEEMDRQKKTRPATPTIPLDESAPTPAIGARRGRLTTDRAPPLPGESHPFAREILTPDSSNVFSFAYDYATSTLFVTYKAPVLHAHNVRTGPGRLGGRRQLRGKPGATVAGKSNERGPLYAYYDVPVRVFERMKMAHSKGKFVWDNLRVRGTIYGHQYRYALMQGAVTIQDGVSGVYIPRKATPRGFRVRSVSDIGQGRRSFQSSTLPSRGFRSRTA